MYVQHTSGNGNPAGWATNKFWFGYIPGYFDYFAVGWGVNKIGIVTQRVTFWITVREAAKDAETQH
jgi:hypothetical protein